ncbi:11660_t:CDS:1 [Dentiscutata erythropus]|uniref:Succinate dehydrogenase assembly factor 3 n=1 Tax=Dentiscutata erythropus TaxID=1348616 RepID=A0A9N9E596_9GLOM|nr:11660_t:CDS:1 [Dentiscutata erythropus]
MAHKNLLPPLTLYRQILRVHRELPPSLRSLGDDYVKSEFKRHKDITNPIHIVGFLSEWQSYLEEIKKQTSILASNEEIKFGKKIELGNLEKFSDQQLGQLYELRNETKTAVVRLKKSE